jgi:hypothetical protein
MKQPNNLVILCSQTHLITILMAVSRTLFKDIKKALINEKNNYSSTARSRLMVLCNMIYSCLVTQNCSIQKMGEHIAKVNNKNSETGVAQAKRWLQSEYSDYKLHFFTYLAPLLAILAKKGELVLVIDGSETGKNCVSLLISVVYGKRAIPICWVTREGKKGHFPQQMHIDLVEKVALLLADVIPTTRIVFLGDGEFDGSKLLEVVQNLGWEFVLRTSLDRKISADGTLNGEKIEMRNIGLLPVANYGWIPNAIGAYNAVLWKEQGYDAPIPLLTNLELAEMACSYYRCRFSIETLFKDFKSSGFQIHKTKVSTPKMIANLLIVVCLCFLLCFALGVSVQGHKDLKLFCRHDRVKDLSHFAMGKKCLSYLIEKETSINKFNKTIFSFLLIINKLE